MEFLIILGLMVGCGVVLSPFYLIGRKKRARLAQEAKEEKPTMSKMKSALYLAIEAVLCIAFFLYLLLNNEIEVPELVGWMSFIGLAVAIAMESKRRRRG